MDFDRDILKTFIPEFDLKYFLAFDNAWKVSANGGDFIVVAYRSPFDERVNIRVELYEARLKEKQRDEKLNTILDGR
jgi:hypothetical protein